MSVYVALLRGINVGGSNLIRMPALKACCESIGLGDVATYIASGNVLFTSDLKDPALATQIEKALSKTFAYDSRVVIRSFQEMKTIVDRAPRGFGKRPSEYRCDVIFLKDPLTAGEAMNSITINRAADRVIPGNGVLYWSRLIAKATQSRISRLSGTPVYQNMTIRNWNTTQKLVELMSRIG